MPLTLTRNRTEGIRVLRCLPGFQVTGVLVLGVFLGYQRRAYFLFVALLADDVYQVRTAQLQVFTLTKLVELSEMDACHGNIPLGSGIQPHPWFIPCGEVIPPAG